MLWFFVVCWGSVCMCMCVCVCAQCSVHQYQCLPELGKLHSWFCVRRRVYKATWNISPHFVLNYKLMLIVLRTGFSSSKFQVFFSFGFNEVLLAEASLTWWERCQTDERYAAWFKTKPWTLLKNNKTYFTCSLCICSLPPGWISFMSSWKT